MDGISANHRHPLVTHEVPCFQYPSYGHTSTIQVRFHHDSRGRVLMVLAHHPTNTGVPLMRSKEEAYQAASRYLAEVVPDPQELQVVLVDPDRLMVRVVFKEDCFGKVLGSTLEMLPAAVDEVDVQLAFGSGTLTQMPDPARLAWVVHQNLSGHEGQYVVRGMLVDTEVRYTLHKHVVATLDEARQVIPPHLHRQGRQLGDPVHVLETWTGKER